MRAPGLGHLIRIVKILAHIQPNDRYNVHDTTSSITEKVHYDLFFQIYNVTSIPGIYQQVESVCKRTNMLGGLN